MKVKIKKTGEIINVAEYATVALEKCNSNGDPIELGFDEIELIQETSSDIDWEQRRYELVKDFESALLSNPEIMSISGIQKGAQRILESVFDVADNMILRLKQK